MTAQAQFTTACRNALQNGQWLKCTLSKPGPGAAQGLKNIFIRPVTLKKGLHLAFNYRFTTRDEVKNFEPEAGIQQLETLLNGAFSQADLFSTEQHFSFSADKNGQTRFAVQKSNQEQKAAPQSGNDRPKQRLLDPAAPWLQHLGITNAKGEVLAAQQDKWRQINKYLEIIDSLLREESLPQGAQIADMGSGKGYLTFALYDFLEHSRHLAPHITGIELRPNLVEFCNKVARQVGFERLVFVAQDIAEYQPEQLDMLIALHACDTATDLALASGIQQKSRIIVAAPCCHKQIRRDMKAGNEMAPLLRHGILEERQAEIVTDGIRALLLEAEGYHTKVFEFISSEHTAKNLMITATRESRLLNQRREKALAQVEALKAGFGIKEHWLEKLLKQRKS